MARNVQQCGGRSGDRRFDIRAPKCFTDGHRGEGGGTTRRPSAHQLPVAVIKWRRIKPKKKIINNRK